MVEPLLSGIVLGLIPVVISGLLTMAYLQFRRRDQILKIMIKLMLELAICTAIRTFNWVQTKDQIYDQYTILQIIKFDEENQRLIAKRCTFYVISLN
jgi:cytochrome b6-f complex subunit 5